MSKILGFFKEISNEISEVRRQWEIYFFLQRYIARNSLNANKSE